MPQVYSETLDERIVPWDDYQPTSRATATKVFTVTLTILGIAVLSAALVAAIANSPYHEVDIGLHFINTSMLGIIGVGLGAMAIAGCAYYLQKCSIAREKKRIKELWIAQQTDGSECAFKVDDEAPHGLAWQKSGAKRVLIITSAEGGAHKTGAAATKKALEDQGYDVYQTVPGHRFQQNALYNRCQKRGWVNLQRKLVGMQSIAERTNTFEIINRGILQDIYRYRPQMVISVQPISNGFIEEETRALGIPFTVISTDLYARHFFIGVNKPAPTFTAALLQNDEQEEGIIRKANGIESSSVKVLGAMLREPFQESAQALRANELQKLKQEKGIADQDMIGLISMGAQGGASIKTYCDELVKGAVQLKIDHGHKLHVFVLCGNNKDLQQTITDNYLPSETLLFHPLGWTGPERVAAIMSDAKFYITKPGGMSTAEAIALNTPVLFDGHTAKASPWEPYNMQVTQKTGLGEEIKHKRFISQVQGLLERSDKVEVDAFAGRTFNENIVAHVNEMTQ